METAHSPLRRVPTYALLAIVVVGYAVLARIGEAILPLDGIAALWPASGFAAVMVLWAQSPTRRVVVLVGIVLGIGVSIAVRGMLFTNELGYLLGNLVEPLVMLPFLIRATRPDGRMARMASVGWLVAGSVAAAGSAAVLVASAATWSFDGTGEPSTTWWPTWASFASGDLLGLLLVAPLMLQATPPRRLWSRGSTATQVALWLLLGASVVLTARTSVGIGAGLVVVIVMALRLDSSAASLAALVISAALVYEFLDGPGVGGDSLVTSIDVRILLPLVAILTQLVSLGTTERLAATQEAENALAVADDASATLRRALDSGLDAFVIAQREAEGEWRLVFVNAVGARGSATAPEGLVGETVESILPFEAARRIIELMEQAHRSGDRQRALTDHASTAVGWQGDFDIMVAPIAGDRVVVTWRDLSELQSAHRNLRSAHAAAMHAATHDALTNLPNRPLMLDRLKTALSALPRTSDRLALVYLDVDNFKTINDRYGHAMGDAVLIAVARRLRELTREGDTAARIAGDEFVLILSGVDSAWDADSFHARLGAAIGEPITYEGITLHVSVSAGLVLVESNEQTPEELLHDADLALYASKDVGRGRLTVFDASLRGTKAVGRPTASELERALEEGELFLAYQPVLDLSSEHVVGREALVRWQHPRYGVLPPIQFLDLAESSGLIAPIGQWVLHQAITDLTADPTGGWVSVNLAPTQLLRASVSDDVQRWCGACGVPPDRVVLELTESQLLDATPAVLRQLQRLRAQGSLLAIDDFGSGYSSIAYLEAFEFDIIKIDRGLLEGESTPRKRAVLSWIATLAEAFGCVTIAEGIERPEHLDLVRAAGVTWGQGYLFGRPAPLAEGVAVRVR